MTFDAETRRRFSRACTAISRASVADILAMPAPAAGTVAHRIGVTGPPGAGKSTLIGRLALERLRALPPEGLLAVLAIDPSSSRSGGALLGDRIRMEAAGAEDRIFVRSLASGQSSDGLADNIADLLSLADATGFSETILETVGVGQAEYALRQLVDTMVLVVPPNSGDAVQAIKAGILELPDIYVVNKCDLEGANEAANAIEWLAGHRSSEDWQPLVIRTSDRDDAGLAALCGALDAHRDWLDRAGTRAEAAGRRRQYHVASLVARRVRELAAPCDGSGTLAGDYATWIRRLAEDPAAIPTDIPADARPSD